MIKQTNRNIIFVDQNIFINKDPNQIHQYLKDILDLVSKLPQSFEIVLNDIFNFIIDYSSKNQILNKDFKNKLLIYFQFIQALHKMGIKTSISVNFRKINLSFWLAEHLNINKIDNLDYLNDFLKSLNKQKFNLKINDFGIFDQYEQDKIEKFIKKLSKMFNIQNFLVLDFLSKESKNKFKLQLSRYKFMHKLFTGDLDVWFLINYQFFKLLKLNKLDDSKLILLWDENDFYTLKQQQKTLKIIAKRQIRICFDVNNLLFSNQSILFFVHKIKALFALSKFISNSLCVLFVSNPNSNNGKNEGNFYPNEMIWKITLNQLQINSFYGSNYAKTKISKFSRIIKITKIYPNEKYLLKINYSLKKIKDKQSNLFVEPFAYNFLFQDKAKG
ncbi:MULTISPECIES: hypothetical protein [unclassified Mycoplasma]|uniref:hypothetical protein n=1 Tax=unclassified Mycoplasma TaxID=2683645 RepID=UPI00211C54F6|nr:MULTISPECIES: hypothetical protein [unclassified Mycoplasma]UUM20113.1 hypothetical protein NPA11_01665 [Mycoplasma sp. 1578d]UUM25093.1 hypothetical protein NPA12_01640 [Mycoplasma sp. 3686d]